MVVRGSAWEAASWTSRSGTPASSAAVMNACRKVCGPTGLVIPARLATRRTTRAAPCRSSRSPTARVDRPRGTGRQRNSDNLAALARDDKSPMPALDAQVLDVGAGGFGDPQPVECQQRDQCVLAWRAQPGGNQQRAQLVAVQAGGVRVVVQPGTADMRGW